MYLAIAGLFISLCISIYQLTKAFMRRNHPIERLKRYIGQDRYKRDEKPVKGESYRHGFGFLARSIEQVGMLEKYKTRVRKKMIKANIPMKPEEFLSIRIMAAALGGFVGLLPSGEFIPMLIAACCGWIIPGMVLRRKGKRRLKLLNNQLGDTIAILSNAMKAGHSFFQAIDSVNRETTGPVSEEFSRLQKEISLGMNTETALQNMVERSGSDDLELMVTAVLIQRQVGGNLAEILDNISGTIRQRIRSKGEIRAITAQGRMSGWIIALLPFILAIIVTVINPEQMKTLLTEPLGIMMLVFAFVMESLGIVFVRRIVNIDV